MHSNMEENKKMDLEIMENILINFIIKEICLQNLWKLPIKPQGSAEKFEHHRCVQTQATNWCASLFYTLTDLSLFIQLHIVCRVVNGVTMPGDNYSLRWNIFVFCILCFISAATLSIMSWNGWW